MEFGVQDFVLDAAALEHRAEHFALLDGDGAHQHRLALLVALHDLVDDGVVLALHGLVHGVVHVDALHRAVRRNLHDREAVDLVELGGLGLRRTRHAREFVVHAEVVLERDGRERLGLVRDLHALFRLNGLMQTLVVAAAHHQTAGELVDDDDLAVAHDVVHVALHHAARLDGLVDVVRERHVLGIREVFHIEVFLRLLNAGLGQRGGLFLFVDDVVAVNLLVVVFLVVQLGHHGRAQRLGKVVGQFVHVGRFVALAGDDERRAGLVDENGVHLVNDGVVVSALHHLLLVRDHVVAQIVEAELVVRAVRDVRLIRGAALLVRDAVHDQSDAQAEEAVHFAHPLGVALGEVVVHRHDVHALAGQCVQVHRERGNERLAFARLHLGDARAVQHDAADDLHGEVLHAEHAPRGLTAGGERLGQDIVERLAGGKTLFQSRRHGLQFLVGLLREFFVQRQHFVGDGADLFQFFRGERTEDFFQKGHEHTSFIVAIPICFLTITNHSIYYSFPACPVNEKPVN